jgi:hypothetical protein
VLQFLIVYLVVIPMLFALIVLPIFQGRPRQVPPLPRPGTPEHAKHMALFKK